MTAISSAARRVTVVTPNARVDVALPLEATLAELLPQLVRLVGAQTRTVSAGWALSRLGGAPLEPVLTVTAAGLRDGDVVYLRPREQYAAPLLFDDVIDAIASAAESRRGAWRPEVARRAGLVAGLIALLGAALLLLAGSDSRMVAAISCGAYAIVLLLAGGALARAYSDVVAGAVCAGAGAFAALVAGQNALPHKEFWPLSAAPFGVGLAAVALYCVVAAVVIADRLALFSGLAVAAAFGAVICAVVDLAGTRTVSACAVGIAVATALCAMAPMISLRMGRLPLPRVPSDVDAFRDEEDATLGPDVLAQTSNAEQILTGLLAAFGAVVVGSSVPLLRDTSRWSWTLAGLAGLVWVLRSRSYAGTVQRGVMLTAGLVVLVLGGIRLAVTVDRTWLLAIAGGVAVVAVVSLAYAARVVRGRRSPYWSRLIDITEFLSLVALLPVVGAILGIYRAVHNLGS